MYPQSYREYDFDDDDFIGCHRCGKINIIFASGSESMCEQCSHEVDDEIESRGGIDKCMNCGRYMYGDQLNKYQVCIRPCRNPNEY